MVHYDNMDGMILLTTLQLRFLTFPTTAYVFWEGLENTVYSYGLQHPQKHTVVLVSHTSPRQLPLLVTGAVDTN